MGRKVKDAGSAERVIRHHVVKLCLENPDKEVKLPSTRDFAEKFGFTMRTITTELAKLVREGWIIGKHGIGYFTVPKKEYHRFKSQKTVGILYGDTQLLQYDFNQWSFMAQAGMSMATLTFQPVPTPVRRHVMPVRQTACVTARRYSDARTAVAITTRAGRRPTDITLRLRPAPDVRPTECLNVTA